MRKRVSTGFKEHLLFGAVVWALFYWLSTTFLGLKDPVVILVTLALTELAALFPDVDTNSKGQDIFYFAFMAADAYLLWKGYYKEAAILGFLAMLPVVVHHRGWTHWWISAFVIPLPLLLPMFFDSPYAAGGYFYYAAAVIGYVSHVFLDRTQNNVLRFIFFWI